MTTEDRYVVKARAGADTWDLWLANGGHWAREKDDRLVFAHRDQACRYALDAACSTRPNRPDLTRYVIEIHEVRFQLSETVLSSKRVI